MESITSFDDWMRRQRKALDITQAELAARVGCAEVTIKKIEQATRRPSRQMAELLADALVIPDAQRDLFLRMARHEYVEQPLVLPASPVPVSASEPELPAAIVEAARPTYFVGRTREMAQLAAHLTGALNGSGRIVFITGEAGHGKTTLMTEFARRALSTYSNLIVAGGNSEAYAGAGTPYLPFRDILALLTSDVETPGHARIISQDQVRRLRALLPRSARALVDQNADLIDTLLAGTRLRQRLLAHPVAAATCQAQIEALAHPQMRVGDVPTRRLLEQYTQFLRTLANRHPLLLLLDDLQWIDRASADMLFYLARRLSGSRVFLLATYRRSEVEANLRSGRAGNGDVHPLIPPLQELKRRHGDIEIDLGRSTPEADRAFVDAVLDSEPNRLSDRFRAEFCQRTQGHPLFTVELLHDMQERGDLVRDVQGKWVEGDAVDWEALPTRVEAVISRRISHLPPILQEGLKIASVEGETFTAEIVAHILGVDGLELVRKFSGIAGRQHHLIVAQGSQRLGNQLLSRYRFVHILFQGYLYKNLDGAERIYLHEAVGNALETVAADQTDAVATQLARHFQAAELPEKAVAYRHVAGRQAMALSAHHEAIAHLTHALTLLPALPAGADRDRRECQLQTDLGVCYRITKGYAAPEVEQAYRRAQALCDRTADPISWSRVLWGLHSVYIVRGALPEADAPAQEFSDLGEGEPVLFVTGHCMLGCTASHMGSLDSARNHFEQARAAYSAEQHRQHIFLSGFDMGVFSLAHLGHTQCYLGYPDQALQTAQEAVELARTLSHPFSQTVALSYLAMLQQLRDDRRAVHAATETTYRLCAEHDIPYYLAWTAFLQGWTMVEDERVAQGILKMEQSLADLQAMQTGLRRPYYLCLLAESYAKAGRVEEGLSLVSDALDVLEEQEQRLYEPELHRVHGELLWKAGAPEGAAEGCFRRAIQVARQQDAKLMELRATTTLARLLQSQSRSEEARQALTGVVGWFDEGLGTAPLQQAKTLLSGLT